MIQLKRTITAISIALAGGLIFSACKKNKDSQSRSELITGTWSLNAYGVDDNMNGILEISEYDPIPAGVNIIETFRADNTGSVTTVNASGTTSYNMKWRLEEKDEKIIITNDNNGTSVTAVISRLNSNEFMGYDPATPIRTIYLLKK